MLTRRRAGQSGRKVSGPNCSSRARRGWSRPAPSSAEVADAAAPARAAAPRRPGAGVEQRHLRDQLLAAHAERVEGAEPREVLGDLATHARARHEVGQRRVRLRRPARGRPLGPPATRFDDRSPRRGAHLLHVSQPHAQRRAVLLHLEPLAAQVDVERQHLEPEAARVVEHHARRVEAHGLVVEDAGVELGRVVRLEPGRGVADDGEAGGVRLVEAVGGEPAQLAEDLVGDLLRGAARHRLLDKVAADGVHLLHRALVRHRAAQQVGLGEAEAGHGRRHLDDLLLVDDDPVGAAQDALHGGVRHDDRLAPVPSPDERRDHVGLQRPRTEERDRRDDVLEVALLQPRREVALPGALELEQADGARRADELVDRGVVARELPGAHPLAGARLDAAHGLGDGRVHLEGEDVHLDEAQRLDVVLVELGHHDALGRPLQRHAVGERVAREDEPAQVRAEVGGEAREALGDVDEAAVVRVLELVIGELGTLGEHLPELGGTAPGHPSGEPVDLLRREPEGAADDAHRRRRAHGVDGGHHGDLVVAEALVDVLDDLVAARRAEVDVDVRHLVARRVEEALEEQLVRDGVGVGDAQHVADDAVAGGAAAGVVDAAAEGELDDVAHGEEVLGEAELLDDLELALEARRDFGGERPVALGGALEAALPEQREGGLARRQRVGGEEELAEARGRGCSARRCGRRWRRPPGSAGTGDASAAGS